MEIVFERQKNSAEGYSKTLSQSDLVFTNPGIYLYSMATVIGKSAKKQFPAYAGEFWSMSQRLLYYLYSMATVIGKSAKKQFPAYAGEFWSMSQRLL